MEVISFKITKNGVTVVREDQNVGHPEAHTLKACPDTPSKSFTDAVEVVRAAIVKRCAIKGATFDRLFTLTGIAVTKASNGRRRYGPSGKIDFGWGERDVDLPLLVEKVDGEKGKAVLSDTEMRHMAALLKEAGVYAGGEREQTSLGLDEGQTEAAKG